MFRTLAPLTPTLRRLLSIPILPPKQTCRTLTPAEQSAVGLAESRTGTALHSSKLERTMVIAVGRDGECVTRSVERRTLAVPPRDLRLVWPPSFKDDPIVVRPRHPYIVASLDHVNALISADEVLLFDWDTALTQRVAPFLVSHLKACAADASAAASDGSDGGPGIELPFELNVLEGLFIYETAFLDAAMAEIEPLAATVVHDVSDEGVASQTNLETLLRLSTALLRLETQGRALSQALTDVLNDDEDMAGLYLTAPRQTADHSEVEFLFEAYAKHVDDMLTRASLTARNLRMTERSTAIRLDASRNRIMQLDLRLSILTASLSASALICGAFGMNLVIPDVLATHPHGFTIASATMLATSAAAFTGVLAYSRAKAILHPSTFSPPPPHSDSPVIPVVPPPPSHPAFRRPPPP